MADSSGWISPACPWLAGALGRTDVLSAVWLKTSDAFMRPLHKLRELLIF